MHAHSPDSPAPPPAAAGFVAALKPTPEELRRYELIAKLHDVREAAIQLIHLTRGWLSAFTGPEVHVGDFEEHEVALDAMLPVLGSANRLALFVSAWRDGLDEAKELADPSEPPTAEAGGSGLPPATSVPSDASSDASDPRTAEAGGSGLPPATSVPSAASSDAPEPRTAKAGGSGLPPATSVPSDASSDALDPRTDAPGEALPEPSPSARTVSSQSSPDPSFKAGLPVADAVPQGEAS